MRQRHRAALLVLLFVIAAVLALRAAPTRAEPACDSSCSDLSVTVSGPDSGHVGVTVEYDIVVENEGPSGTSAAVVTDTLPDGAALVSVSTTQGSCDAAPGGVLTCDLGALDYPGIATIALTVLPRTAGSNFDSASVQSALSDPVSENNQAITSGSMSDGLGAVFSKVGPATATNNTAISYTLTTQLPMCLIVGGVCTSGAVTVTDTLPVGETFLSVSAPGASCTTPAVGAGGTITCTWSPLDISVSPATLIETLTVQLSTTATSITNTATEHDDFFGGETSLPMSATTQIVAAAPAAAVVILSNPSVSLGIVTQGCGSLSPSSLTSVNPLQAIPVTALPCPGSVFVGWTGGPCNGTRINPCDIAPTGITTITATFAP
jgi:uncharacterized repeat protein (TIGR01451 family)